MPRRSKMELEELLLPGKIRKRGCSSPASSSSSILPNSRFKRAILVGKRGGSTTPVPTWRLLSGGGKATHSPGGKGRKQLHQLQLQQQDVPQQQQPVSARKLAATLWEMNEVPSPKDGLGGVGMEERRRMRKECREREKVYARSVRSGSLPPHLSDPSHSPVSERMDRSGSGSHQRRASLVSQKLRIAGPSVGPFDSVSNASQMEIKTRSQAQTPTGSVVGVNNRLRDVSNALTTSKELLKIINRVWGNEERPSSSMSLISALHAELERARLQVNHFIQEQRSEQTEIRYLMKCFAEEKAGWKNKEQKVVEAAIESVVGELEVEKKLRRSLESLNKILGKELAECRTSLNDALKELESEKRARVVIEEMCNELAGDICDDKAEVRELKKESAKLCKGVDKEREMKLSGGKYQIEEKHPTVDRLRSQLVASLGSKRAKEKGHSSFDHMNDEEIEAYLSKACFGSYHNELNRDDGGEVDDGVECAENSVESGLCPIELSMDNYSKIHERNQTAKVAHDFRKMATDGGEIKARHSTSSKVPRRSTSIQRSASDVVSLGAQSGKLQLPADALEWVRHSQREREGQEDYEDDINEGHLIKDLREYYLSGYGTPRQLGRPRGLPDSKNASQERPHLVSGNVMKSRLADSRKSKW